MTEVNTADRVVVSVTATDSGDWQVVSVPTGFRGITAPDFAENDYLHGFVRHEDGEQWEVYDFDGGDDSKLLQVTSITGTVTLARPATPWKSNRSDGARMDAGSGTHTMTIALGAGSMARILRELSPFWKTFTSADASPSVAGYRWFKTNGSTTITRFDDLTNGQGFWVRWGGTDIVIQNNSDIVLLAGADQTLSALNPAIYFAVESNVAKQMTGNLAPLDEDDFASDSALRAPSQQSVKAYIASQILDEDDMASNSATKAPSQQSIKAYVDNVATGLNPKASVKAATTANITLSGGQTIDAIAVTTGDRVLVKDQSTASQNGIYVVASGSWSRASDMDAWAEVPSAYVWVSQGTTNADTGWVCTADAGGTIGSTTISWIQFGGANYLSPAAQTYVDGKIQNTLTAGVTTIGAAQDIVLSSIKATGAGNLCYNSSFEVGTGTVADGWSMSSSGGVTATASIVTSTLNVAGRAQQVVLSGLSSSLVNDIRTIANGAYFMPLDKPQGTFTASAMLYAPVGLNARIIMQFGTVSGDTFTPVNTVTGTLTAATGAWQQITVTGTAGATATHAIMFLRTAGGSLTSGTVLWDNAQLEQGSIATTWRENVSRDRFARFYNVLDACTSMAQRVGVVAGTVNLDTIWTAALTAAIAANMNIYIPPGTYTLGSSVTGLPLNIGANAVGVQGAGRQTKITKTAGNQSVFYCNVICPAMLNGRIGADVAPGAKTITFESGQNPGTFAANDILLLNDLGNLVIDNTRRGGEFVTVQSVDNTGSGSVTLWHPIKYTHLAGTTAGKYGRLTKPTLLQGVFVKDLWIDGNSEINSGTDTVNTIDVSPEGLIVLRWCQEAVVSGVFFSNWGCTGVRFLNSYKCQFRDSTGFNGGSSTTGTSDPTSTEGLGGFSYLACETALNEGNVLENVTGIGVRHVHTTTSAPFNDASTVYANYGEPYGSKIINCRGWYCKNMTFDQHELGRNIHYENCTAYDCHYAGWQIRTREVTLKNCAVINAIGPAVWIRGNGSGNALADHCTIDGLEARYTNLGTSFDSIDWTVVGAVLDDAHNTRSRRINAYKTGAGALQIGDSISPNNSQHCDISLEDVCQNAASLKFGVYLKKVGTTGVCRIDRVRSYSSDAKVVDILNIDSGIGAATIAANDIKGSGHTGAVYTNNSTSAVFTYNADALLRIARTSTQYFESVSDGNYNGFKSFSPPSAAKAWIVDVKTDAAGTAVSGGALGFSVRFNGTTRFNQTDTGRVEINGAVTITGDRCYAFPNFTATQIGQAAHSVNTTDKLVGKTIYDSTNSRLLMALGTSATSGWSLVTGGGAVITPA